MRHAAFVEGGAEGLDERVHVFGQEELAVAADARGVIEEGDEPGLHRRAVELDIRPVERVGLPHFIGVGFGKGQAEFVGAFRVGLEQFVLLDQPAEGVGGDLRAGQQALPRCRGGRARPAVGRFAVDFGQHLADGFQHVFRARPCGSCPCRSGACFP